MNRLRYERDIASLVSELRLCVLNAAPFENRWWRLTANQGTGFTDEMRMHIAWDISPSPTSEADTMLYIMTESWLKEASATLSRSHVLMCARLCHLTSSRQKLWDRCSYLLSTDLTPHTHPRHSLFTLAHTDSSDQHRTTQTRFQAVHRGLIMRLPMTCARPHGIWHRQNTYAQHSLPLSLFLLLSL